MSSKDIIVKLKNFGTSKDILGTKIKLNIDNYLLNSIIAFIYKESVLKTKKTLSNFLKLFNMLDMDFYEDKPIQSAKIWIIVNTLKVILNEKIENADVIKTMLKEDPECQGMRADLIETIENLSIGYEESKKLIRMMDDRLQYGYVLTIKQMTQEIMDYIDEEDYRTYKEVSDILYQLATNIIQIRRNNNSLDSDSTFSLEADKFESCITDAVEKLQDKMKMLRTGIRRLNTLLAPAYLSKRLYTYLAFPGGGKSQILLKTAVDVKKYNHVKPKNPDNNPCVLYITMENSIEETVERLFNMTVSSDDIRNYTPKQVIKKLREGGKMVLTDESNINIIMKYYPNKSINTDDLYGIINDLEDEGNECIMVILDYLKRIRSANRAKDEKEELKNVTDELKNLATFFDIPVVTAHQLNRSAASVVDAAMQANKEDLAKLIGRDSVGSAWEIQENSDVCIILNQEVKKSTGQLYMTFKLTKRRYRSTEEDEHLRRLEYFNHPYEIGNDIRLIDDVELDKSVSVELLGNDLAVSEQMKPQKQKQQKKQEDVIGIDDDDEEVLEFQPFDIGISNYRS